MGDDSDYVDDSESAMPSIGIKQEGELEEKSVEEKLKELKDLVASEPILNLTPFLMLMVK